MGGGSDDQVEALGIYFERIGVAFQVRTLGHYIEYSMIGS
jgi:hypothetical protein